MVLIPTVLGHNSLGMLPLMIAWGATGWPASCDVTSAAAAVDAPGYGETPWRSASRTISTRPFAPSLPRMCEI